MKIWWKCSKGHEWQATPNNRTTSGTGCPFCSNRRVLFGYNDLATINPDVAKEWNYDKNGDLKPENIVYSSHKKVWWKCSKGHEWQTDLDHRNKGGNCPICSNKKVLKGYNDLYSQMPELAKEWNYDKNGGLLPEHVTKGSDKKVWWKCSNGHEWQAHIYSRSSGVGCPYCANKIVSSGFNDLATSYPELAKEWDFERNAPLTPDQIIPGSHNKYYWLCSLGHSYFSAVEKRISGKGCPYCGGRKVLRGFNDLENWCISNNMKDLLEQWDYTKNAPLSPNQVMTHSNRDFYWICSLGHSFKSTPNSRTRDKAISSCPVCLNQQVLEGYNDLRTWCKNSKHDYLIEEWDNEKNPPITQFTAGSNKKAHWICPMGHSYSAVINSRTKRFRGCPTCAKVSRTSFPEQAMFYYVKRYFSDAINLDTAVVGIELDIYIPSLKTAIEYDGVYWHKTNKAEVTKNNLCKNKNITLIRIREEGLPTYEECVCVSITPDPDYDEMTRIINKTLKLLDDSLNYDIDVNRDFAVIYAQYVTGIKGRGLLSYDPSLAEKWDYEKNNPVTPDLVYPNSHRKFYWICSNGHSFQSAISNMVRNQGTKTKGCPYCSGKKVLRGYNDLATRFPNISEEWDYEKNYPHTPNDIVSGCNKKYWWICSLGHSYEAKVSARTSLSPTNCPICTRRKVQQGYNDLETWCKNNNMHHILDEWDYEKNKKKPSEYTSGSEKKVYWICPMNHSYVSMIINRTRQNTGCPECAKTVNCKKILCVELNRVFGSIKEAEDQIGISSHIGDCCKGKRKTAGGYHWRFVDDN